ncbi:MAG: mechanosensitive ion channel family protein [Lachnospiraceae bacterium]
MKVKKNFIGLILAIVVLVFSGVIGSLTGVFEGVEDISGMVNFNPETILKVGIVIGFLWALNCLIQLVFSLFKNAKGRTKTLAAVTASLTKYLIVIIGFCWILTIIGVNVSTIFASIGIIALIIGFGAESLVADLVTGIFVLFENQFNVGDIIEVSGFRGIVENVGIRTVTIRDNGGNLMIVKNSELGNVLNRSEKGSVAITEIGVSYSTDLEELEKKMGSMLSAIKTKHPDIFIGEISYLGVENLAESSVVLKFKADVEEKNIFSGRRVLNKELKCAFDRENIVIAFPQLDIHTQ